MKCDRALLPVLFVLLGCSAPLAAAAETISSQALPLIERFETFGLDQGIPSHKVHAVFKTSDEQLWIGTWDGLCRREADGKFKRYGPEQGLSHRLVLCMAE